MNLDDTIVAIATPPGRGGIGIVRLAGPQAKAIADPMLRLGHDLEPGRATVCANVAFSPRTGFITPRQFGPMRREPG